MPRPIRRQNPQSPDIPMATGKFIDLPPEIICQIYQSAADFAVVNALARTSQALHSVWLANSPSIFHAVAVQALPNFLDAERLLHAQEETYTSDHPKSLRKKFPRHERFLSNARCAFAACKHWEEVCLIHEFERARGDNPAMRPSERIRFKTSFYHLWRLCTYCNSPSMQHRAQSFLDDCKPIELARLDENATWAKSFNDNEFGNSGLDFKDGTWTAGIELVGKCCSWDDATKSAHRRIPVQGDEAPLGFWVFFDHTQHYLQQLRAYWRMTQIT